jgi:arsenite methyltransferase
MSQLEFNEDMAARLEVVYRTRDILRRRQLVREALAAAPGERILDVGCGPGFYVAELLERVGGAGAVVGVDSSPQMLAYAARRCQEYDNLSFHEAEATSLPLDDAAFDAALSVQVLEYVSDIHAALAEIHRVLRPGGRVVIWDVDWATLSVHSSDPARTERVLRAWDAHLAHPSLPRSLAASMRSAGFEDVRMDAHAFASTEFTPDVYFCSLLPLIEQYVTGRAGVTEKEARAWVADVEELARRGEFFYACIQFCFTATRAA